MERVKWQPDGELLAAVVADDGRAFAVFYRRYLPVVLAFLRAECRDREVAADLAAEVFAAVLLAAGRYRSRGSAPAAPWVLGIARNKVRESRRRGRVEDRARRRLALDPEVLRDEDLDRVDELAGSAEGLVVLLEQLPEREREAVRGRVLEERSYAELASELRCSELVVRQGVSRGLARMRKRLTEEGHR